jgi:hypothetical protein
MPPLEAGIRARERRSRSNAGIPLHRPLCLGKLSSGASLRERRNDHSIQQWEKPDGLERE